MNSETNMSTMDGRCASQRKVVENDDGGGRG